MIYFMSTQNLPGLAKLCISVEKKEPQRFTVACACQTI